MAMLQAKSTPKIQVKYHIKNPFIIVSSGAATAFSPCVYGLDHSTRQAGAVMDRLIQTV